ncbi:sodium:proton antiporter [Pseudomonas sp.]|jgi:multicomponent Na+:H+ antiporter subunit C|uniref:sodium:proton antiporter n=1 Tax=Pseudomonas sp. TaxID=306 RepID=UPI00272FE2E6|nr:sodium:proton antiporter [Pseudomonas sp.]MDP2245840.1 sodium:proton antiporter [Pseudomonas sp.]
MEWIAALTTGGMAGFGLWMLLDRNLKRVVLGVAVLGNAINLGVITAGRFGGQAAFVSADGTTAELANPLPQALVLTAIVIGFSLFIFALALLKRTRELHGDNSTDSISSVTEQPAPDWPASEHENAKIASEHAEPRS